ncbi:Nucleoporin [Fulvia fulva]|uniref:Nucleoporin n=1 Tax=Passalora fulva TaxID=5499 RepID=A0A9Q8PKY2_PASFU|nr:Nucleoporin [Fulvia fulva]KAK4610659.1 Nucleoporin [Fulvia fulva]KAK4610960.1 Nucleoporin [Fulvia fulva]UJO24331.1 Nucleoporin [Fulvia fulva]WPV22037.1 Nucleoporin [Fulvia fulva]WPV36633.1 Nucleoporin [Fulvia fulva]
MSNSQTPERGTERRNLRSTRSTASATAAANPRRRQRDSADGTQKPPAPKRRRHNKPNIDEETFEPPSQKDARDSTEHLPLLESFASQATTVEDDTMTNLVNGNIHLSAEGSVRGGSMTRATPSEHTTMTIRGRPKRVMRGDNATVLAQTSGYSVKLLPSTPRELRKEGVEYRGSLGTDNTALAVTRERAIIWDYTAHSAASNPRTFDMPFSCRAGDALPYGALVSHGLGSTTDLGLLLLSATTGKAVFYESIHRATSLGLFQDRKTGVEGSIGSLFSSETVVDLVSADHAGFVVVLSSGRITQVTLHDAQGKARIFSQFLKATESTSGSFFGSFSNLWSAGFRKDLAAVHTRQLNSRGQVQAVALTEQVEILVWDMDWAGRSDFRSSITCKEALVGDIRDLLIPELAGKAETIMALDFAILDKPTSVVGNEVATAGTEVPLGLLILLRAGTLDDHIYLVADVVLTGDIFEVSRLVQLKSYRHRGDARYQTKPKLTVPKPGHTAFVSFEDATVLFGLRDAVVDGPEAQLHMSYMEPDQYEEAIVLRTGKDIAIESAWDEGSRGSHASCLSFVKGAGLVRITGADVYALDMGWKLSAMTHIEQAVFFGAMQQDNIIDFSRRSDIQYSLEEVEEAALAISNQIVRAETKYTNVISTAPTSMEQHLAAKAQALKALAAHVRRNYAALSRSTMWRLLWNAERVAAAQQLWVAFEEHVTMMSEKGKRKATLLDEICDWFNNESHPEEPFTKRKELKDEEPVRKFFIGGLHRLEKLLQYTKVFLDELRKNDDWAQERVLRVVIQTNDVFLRGLRAAFIFRSENAAEYGILPELIDDGVVTDIVEYTDVPEFWTSTERLVSITGQVTTLSRSFASGAYENYEQTTATIEQLAREIADANPNLIELLCLQFKERINWRSSRPSQKDQVRAQQLLSEFESLRHEHFRSLANVGHAEDGMRLAEKYRDMHTLTDIVVGEDQYNEEQLQEAPEQSVKAIIYKTREDLNEKVKKFFDRYGSAWADAFFDKLFSGSSVGKKLEQAQARWQKSLATYLQSHPSRAKICWINDVTQESDFSHASSALAQAAEAQEGRLWAKKVELSMSKLALLAAKEAGESTNELSNGTSTAKDDPRNELAVVEVQERLYAHLYPEIVASLDRDAEVEICMQKFGNHVKDWPALRQLLENGLHATLNHIALSIEQLIDVLTLMDIVTSETEGNMQGTEFMLALIALDAAAPSMSSARLETLLQLIWKRCYIYDDWAKLKLSGKTKQSDSERGKELRATAPWQTLFHMLDTKFFDSTRHVDVRKPSECLGSACRREDISYRFDNEELLDPILHDLKIQDELLQSYVSDRHLDELMMQCDRDAKIALHAQEEGMVVRSQHERDFPLQGEDADLNGAGTNGHAKGANGNQPEYAEGFAQDATEVDGDVEME